jgi:hypothetical protein
MRPTATAGAWKTAAYGRDLVVRARRLKQSHAREARVRFARGLFACAVFLALLGAGWMIGARPFAAAPPDEAAAAKAGERNAGQIVAELPDGISCVHTPFDNVTQQVGASQTVLCDSVMRNQRGSRSEFSWGR